MSIAVAIMLRQRWAKRAIMNGMKIEPIEIARDTIDPFYFCFFWLNIFSNSRQCVNGQCTSSTLSHFGEIPTSGKAGVCLMVRTYMNETSTQKTVGKKVVDYIENSSSVLQNGHIRSLPSLLCPQSQNLPSLLEPVFTLTTSYGLKTIESSI